MCAQKLVDLIPTFLIIKTGFALHYNNLLTCVTMATNLLDFITMTIRFYMESGIARFQIDIRNNVLVNFSVSFHIPIVMPSIT
jgi:hypothetical protein